MRLERMHAPGMACQHLGVDAAMRADVERRTVAVGQERDRAQLRLALPQAVIVDEAQPVGERGVGGVDGGKDRRLDAPAQQARHAERPARRQRCRRRRLVESRIERLIADHAT